MIITNALIYTCDDGNTVIKDGYIRIADGKIIGPGSMSALGYSQSLTIGSGGASGELYLGKTDRQILGLGNQIGSYSPVQELVREAQP